jgi:hypothetical protein
MDPTPLPNIPLFTSSGGIDTQQRAPTRAAWGPLGDTSSNDSAVGTTTQAPAILLPGMKAYASELKILFGEDLTG